MLKVLYDPDGFFSELSDPGLRIPLIIVGINGIIGGIVAYESVKYVSGFLPYEARAFIPAITIAGAVFAFLTPYVKWVVLTAVFYLIGMFFNRKEGFRRHLAFTGYGFIPLIIRDLISGYFSINILRSLDLTSISDITSYRDVLSSYPGIKLAGLISILFILWSANIMVFGVARAGEIRYRDAIVVVGIPVGAILLYTVSKVIL